MRLRNISLRFIALSLSLGAVLFSSCSTEFDSNADYKEIMVIYSVLNPTETVHYVKVNKAFLNTKTNALTIAANNPDSTTYGNELQVKLQKLRNSPDSTILAEYTLERYISHSKQPGTFFSDSAAFYRTTPGKPGTLDDQAIYRIVATNTRTGVTASGATQIVKDNANAFKGFCVYQISAKAALSGNCYSETQTSEFEPQLKGNYLRFHPAENAHIYTAKLVFNYTETTDGVTTNKQVEWYLKNNFIHSFDPQGSSIDFGEKIEDNLFYTNLLNLIDTNNDKGNTVRHPGDVFVTVTGGSESLETYFQINRSFSLISQTRPEYDNITNGTGLVGSRRQKVVKGILTVKAVDELIGNPAYSKLKFQR